MERGDGSRWMLPINEMSDKIISISIAAYNIEKYVKQTLDSFIIPEIMDKLEVIVVNDGSKDSTSGLARTYSDKYPDTFKVVDKENGGYGSTINVSSLIASGKYYKTIDGDDWVDRKGMIALVHYLETSDDDIVVTNFARVSDKNGRMTETIFDAPKYEVSMSFEDGYRGQELYMQGLAIKTEILKRLKLNITEHCFYTDIEYILTPVPFFRTMSFLNQTVYMYRIAVNEQSMSVAGKRKHIDEQLKVFDKMLQYYEEQYDKLSEQKRSYFEVILSGMMKSHITAILSLNTNRSSSLRLDKFENNTLKKNQRVFNMTNRFKVVKILRKSHYKLYWIGSLSYKVYQRLLSCIGR